MKRPSNTVYDNIDYDIQRSEDKRTVRRAVIAKLTEKRILGYPTYKPTYQQFVEQILKPRVLKITKYIRDRKLCHITFLHYASEKDLRRII